MKIPLILEEELKKIEEKEFIERRIILPATLVGRGLIRTNFIIDTGCPYSFISYSTLLKLNLKRGECIIRKMAIGNVTVNLFTIPSLKFYLKTDEEKTIQFTTSINVAMPHESEKKIEKAISLPDILGLDFLIHHKLKLFLNLSENVQYLEV